jgi:pyruvate dehydrogenase E2 component (dihydrolipoamide acetyltransferase)
MATEFIMPKLGLTMEEGTILEWLVSSGDLIEPGMPILRIETDKVESDVEATAAGRIHVSGNTGETYTCGAVIGYVLADGETAPTSPTTPTVPEITKNSSPETSPVTNVSLQSLPKNFESSRSFVSPNAYRIASTLGVNLATVTGSGPGGRIVSEDVEEAAARSKDFAAVSSVVHNSPATIRGTAVATAAARQLADLLGIDLNQVPVPSEQSRIGRDDVALYVRQRLAAPSTSVIASSATTASPGHKEQPLGAKKMSGMRGTIAKRMHASLQEMAQLTLHMDADFDQVIEHRQELRTAAVTPGITDYLLAASGRAIAQHRYVNAQVVGDAIAELPDVHIGLAVAIPGGLVVPVIRHADRSSLFDIAQESKRLATAAREGQLRLEDLEGGTFSVTALGMFGVDGFTPVINPPNAAILGVGRLRDDIVIKKKGKISTVKRLTLSLTWDHRVFDGAPAAEFCQSIVENLRHPESLI